MKEMLAALLVDPVQRQPLQLQDVVTEGDEILAGKLVALDKTLYEIRDRIPRLVASVDEGQQQTSQAFGFKWARRDTYDSVEFKKISADWLTEKYGFQSISDLAGYFSRRELILDVGCGSGYSSSLWLDTPAWTGQAIYVGVDISTAVDVAWQRLMHVSNVHFIQADALSLPFSDQRFDTVFSEGVLHHTPSTREALLSASRVLASGGEFLFYVYKRKGPVREFTDDNVREQIASLSDDEAWEAMRSLTQLGQLLWESGAQIEVPNDVPLLGIKSGQYHVQRLIYWNFAKLYWHAGLSFEENVHVNFDWYRPRYAHRQTEAELRQWCEDAHLSIDWFHIQDSGFSVRAKKH